MENNMEVISDIDGNNAASDAVLSDELQDDDKNHECIDKGGEIMDNDECNDMRILWIILKSWKMWIYGS